MIQQKVELQLILVGDGIADSFSLDISRAYGLYVAPGPEVEGPTSTSTAVLFVINPDALPDGVTVDFAKLPNQSTLPGTVSASISRHTLTLAFDTPPSGQFFIGISLLFNG